MEMQVDLNLERQTVDAQPWVSRVQVDTGLRYL